ncbi:FimV/HubP family polar landmark protein [Marinobacter sp. SS13-12]|uniref:FimV/HubP family polar landmark protein n=1 Tax=Marinobacter sp. SS13-12 TaxID=3050451 RepID=UPI0025524443|nr:FimV/HubP family polar landmark protein [Marinobacter sp. SS13-12]MDK8464342.1 FimV/HubP family polar landmark protein [Marinobacter sp. SS13-12]
MKVRKLAVALALAGGLGSGVAQALGLGEIELQSYLNEPLDAEINLRKSEGVDPGDVFVNIAPESAYDRVGIDRNYFLTKLDFRVTTARDGSLVVNVSSREPLREPYLNFLLEVTWPNGRLMREYAVLVDPPVYAEESGVQEQISAPATRQASQPSQRQAQPRAQARSQEPQRSTSQRSRTFGPTGPSDTLWNIAVSVRPDSSLSTQQVMLALQDLNPDAFIGGNINRLKRGEVLRVPSIEDIRSRSRDEATRQVALQNEAFSSPERTVDATDTQVASGQDTQGATGGDELRLLASDDSGSRDADEGGSAGGDGNTAGGVDAGSAVAMEELESARRENDELTGRVDDLQEQVETLQRLLELKNTQLAEIQQADAEGSEEQPVDAPDDETLADQVAEDGVEAEGDSEADLAEAEPDQADTAETDAVDADEMADDQVAAADDDEAEPSAMGEEPSASDGEPSAMDEDSGMEDEDLAATGSDDATADDERDEEAAVAAPSSQQPGQQPTTPPAQPDQGFPGNIISAITNNTLYQVALGGGLILLLLLLLLLARRNANREKEFYDQLNGDADSDTDTFDLTLDDEEGAESPEGDPLAEADTYIAYGRMDQAAQSLETAISREPSRTDLRLKLLGVYADTQDRASFEKQLGEVEALDDDEAIAEAHDMRSRLEEAESMPSIDDLESQLRSDSYGTEASVDKADDTAEDGLSDEFASDRYESRPGEEEEDEFGSLETDFSELDLDEQEEARTDRESGPDDMIEYDLSGVESSTDEKDELTEQGASESEADDLADNSFDFTLEDESTDEAAKADDEEDLSFELDDVDADADEFASLELDEEELEPSGSEPEPETAEAEESKPEEDDLQEGDLDSLDESFLDELDAELDKVAGDEGASGDSDENELDDLELDVSDEDLALMEEFADSGDSAGTDGTDVENDAAPLDEELGLEDALSGEEPADPEETVAGAEAVEEELPELGADAESDEANEEPPVASTATASKSADIDESDLGDDDDFDFLSGTDEASTKLDLARAYVEMGDVDGARDILEEVALEGNEEQKAEAQDLLKNLS